jgi:hypothetical protein
MPVDTMENHAAPIDQQLTTAADTHLTESYLATPDIQDPVSLL